MIERNKTAQCMDALHDGPAITSELCATTGLSPKDVGSLMSNAYRRGKVAKCYFHDGLKEVQLWMLPEHAAAFDGRMVEK